MDILLAFFKDATVSGIPLLAIVIGLTQWIKGFSKLSGEAVRGLSMGIGLLFGGGFIVTTQGVPAAFGGWFVLVVYGIGLGLVASGLYDANQGTSAAQQ